MNNKTLNIAVSGLNATDNPWPGVAVIRSIRESPEFDGIITGRLVDTAKEKGIRSLVGERIADGVKVPPDLEIKSFSQLG